MSAGNRSRRALAAFVGAMLLTSATAWAGEPRADLSVEVQRRLARAAGDVLVWYERTPAGERMAWGGLGACVVLGVCVTLERLFRLRRRAVIPNDFLARFLDRLHEGKLDGGKALDYCEMNPSPAARVALAAVRRWGRPAVDLERAVGLAHRWESEQLRRNVGTLRRITALAPLVGLLGSLLTADRLMREAGEAAPGWPALADALAPLIFGVGVGVVAMVLYDLLTTRVERLGAALDRLGAETIDAVAMTTVVAAPTLGSHPSSPHIRLGEPLVDRRPTVAVPVREAAPRRLREDPSIGA
ncbi:MotA/TolQ/ExbB proton channel family protein [Paludisphaera soli]|uniref:MotA/TolQ/ExbB proton channel family protein n=1 Tax=Paludisphaera soli TaxID=2712865 RepID=UPI0013EC05FA|nr:MotA/TolQ/ExbB proton channel family protein [Paludisphaera soli]